MTRSSGVRVVSDGPDAWLVIVDGCIRARFACVIEAAQWARGFDF